MPSNPNYTTPYDLPPVTEEEKAREKHLRGILARQEPEANYTWSLRQPDSKLFEGMPQPLDLPMEYGPKDPSSIRVHGAEGLSPAEQDRIRARAIAELSAKPRGTIQYYDEELGDWKQFETKGPRNYRATPDVVASVKEELATEDVERKQAEAIAMAEKAVGSQRAHEMDIVRAKNAPAMGKVDLLREQLESEAEGAITDPGGTRDRKEGAIIAANSGRIPAQGEGASGQWQ